VTSSRPADASGRGRRSRRLSSYGVLLVSLAALGGLYAAVAPSGNAANRLPGVGAQTVSYGRQLYEVSCASCHGLNAEGGSNAPSLIGVGAAAVDFQVGTGRMPAATHQAAEEPRKPPRFSQDQIHALAAYVASLAPGPAIPSDLNYQATDPALGGDLFRTNCAACHNAIGSGGDLTYGAYAPSLSQATPTQIYEAMLTGPEQMPPFSNSQLSSREKLSIINYLMTTRNEANPGGNGLGRIGPIPEGAVGWIAGIGLLVGVTVWIGARA